MIIKVLSYNFEHEIFSDIWGCHDSEYENFCWDVIENVLTL